MQLTTNCRLWRFGVGAGFTFSTMSSIAKAAQTLASILRFDPLAAAQIRATIPPKELITLLGLDGYVAEQLAEVAQKTDIDGFPEILRLAAEERRRQVLGEKFSLSHDDAHVGGELALAAAAYCVPPLFRNCFVARLWPWGWSWWKPTPKDRRRELVKAIALIVAEDQRLHRAEKTP